MESGETTVSIVTDCLGAEESGQQEQLSLTLEVEKPHAHSYTAVITEPSCTEGGYTTYTCECGDTYVADPTEALGHDWHGTACSRCEEKRENPFMDVPENSYYIDPVLWAVEKGITEGIGVNTFGVDIVCNRAQVVTFLYRALA